MLGLRLCEGLLQLRQVGATPHRGARASHYRGLSCCGAQAPDAQTQQLWLTGLVAPRHVGSSQTRARTRVPRISRQTLISCSSYTPFLPCFPYWLLLFQLPNVRVPHWSVPSSLLLAFCTPFLDDFIQLRGFRSVGARVTSTRHLPS